MPLDWIILVILGNAGFSKSRSVHIRGLKEQYLLESCVFLSFPGAQTFAIQLMILG